MPKEDKYTISRTRAENEMIILFGGRAAEEIALNEQTSGAGNDIERGTELARKMICEWGMSDTMGPLAFGQKEEEIFLGRDLAMRKDYSERTAQMIDEEIRRIVTEAYGKAKKLLLENRDKLEKLAQTLLEREVLNAVEIEMVLKGETLPPVIAKAQNKSNLDDRAKKQKKEKTVPAPSVVRTPDPVGGKV